ncbi:MAG: substrate-binding domain-containing protein, partial [Chloroflexi bacterium]|nr:substrate-binding domain-containing protein [Chloroflexota bacterium]
MSSKKFISLILSLMVIFTLLASCATPPATPAEGEAPAAEAPASGDGAKTIKIGVSIANFNDTFLTYMTDGMKEYAATLGPDVEVTYVDAKEDTAAQLAQVENFIAQGVSAIVVVP